MSEKENKITKEIAEQDFNNWCDEVDIEYDESEMNEEARNLFISLKAKIIKGIVKGSCVVNGDKLEYTLSDKNDGGMSGKTIVINPPTSKTFMSNDGFKENQQMHKMASCMSSVTGLDIGVFTRLWGKDFSFLCAVIGLFLTI